jgi:hypothetical protein
MTPTRGVSIKLFLADGSPTGLWIVEKSNWTGVALAWPRALHTEARQRSELERPGVYVLLSPSEVPARKRVYIGEADVLRNRLDRHQANMDFWTRAVAFTTKDTSLNKAHVRYLEARLVELAHAANRDVIENNTVPQRPALSGSRRTSIRAIRDEKLNRAPASDWPRRC